MADELIGITETQRRELILGMVQKQLIATSKLAGTIMNVSQYAVAGAKSISFPRTGGFTVQDKTENTAVDAQTLTYVSDTLSLNVHRPVNTP